MFQCKNCVRPEHSWMMMLPSCSYGPCEVCGKTSLCADAPYGYPPEVETTDDTEDTEEV